MNEYKPVDTSNKDSESSSDDEDLEKVNQKLNETKKILSESENTQTDLESPHGTFGNVLHALTFGLLGNQHLRTDREVANEYKVKSRNNEVLGPMDNHPYEEYSEEGYDHTHPKQLKLVKVKKSDTQKRKEMEEIHKEHEEQIK